MDGDLDGSGHRDHARAQLGVPDGDPRPGWPGNRAGAQLPGCLAAQARDGVKRRPGVTGQRCAGADVSGANRLLQRPDRVADVIQQRFQVPARAWGGALPKLRSAQRGTGESVADSFSEQLPSPAQRVYGRTAGPGAGLGPVARYSGGRPNDPNRPGFWKLTIRAIPVAVIVRTSTACA
jgi:hypothetical protein